MGLSRKQPLEDGSDVALYVSRGYLSDSTIQHFFTGLDWIDVVLVHVKKMRRSREEEHMESPPPVTPPLFDIHKTV